MKTKFIKAIIFSLFLLNLGGCAETGLQTIVEGGSSLSTTSVNYKPTTPNKVRLYYSATPKNATVIGKVAVENDNFFGLPHSQKVISDALKKHAASLGANAVIHIHHDLSETIGDAAFIK